MDYTLLLNILLHGFGLAYMLLIGSYLLFTRRSFFDTKVKQSILMRKTTGVAILAWGATFATGLAEYFLSQTYDYDFASLSLMLDLFLVPVIIIFMLSLIQMRITRTALALHVTIPTLLFVWFIFTQASWSLIASIVYWAIDILAFFINFLRMQNSYKRKLKEQFSELQNRELHWINKVAVLFMCYVVVYLVGNLYDIMSARNLSYIVSMAGWTYIVWHVEHQEMLVDFWTSKEIADPLSQLMSSDSSQQDTESVHVVIEHEWIGEMLSKECKTKMLYLEPDLSIAELATKVGTNRTYLSQYFSSQGTSFYNYINSLRIEHAIALIKEHKTGLSVDDISNKSGFNSPSTFRRAFAERMGCTPALYIAKLVGRKDLR